MMSEEIWDISLTSIVQDMNKENWGSEDKVERMYTSVKENVNCKAFQAQNVQETGDTRKRPNLQITEIEEGEKT